MTSFSNLLTCFDAALIVRVNGGLKKISNVSHRRRYLGVSVQHRVSSHRQGSDISTVMKIEQNTGSEYR